MCPTVTKLKWHYKTIQLLQRFHHFTLSYRLYYNRDCIVDSNF